MGTDFHTQTGIRAKCADGKVARNPNSAFDHDIRYANESTSTARAMTAFLYGEFAPRRGARGWTTAARSGSARNCAHSGAPLRAARGAWPADDDRVKASTTLNIVCQAAQRIVAAGSSCEVNVGWVESLRGPPCRNSSLPVRGQPRNRATFGTRSCPARRENHRPPAWRRPVHQAI